MSIKHKTEILGSDHRTSSAYNSFFLMYDCRDPSVNLSLIIISHAVEWVNSTEGRRVGGLMLFMELWDGYILWVHAHTHIHFFLISLLLPFSLRPPEPDNRRQLIEQTYGARNTFHHFKMKQVPFFFFLSVSTFFFLFRQSLSYFHSLDCWNLSIFSIASLLLSSHTSMYIIISLSTLFLLSSSCLLHLWTR